MGAPKIGIGLVDVRDVAEAHYRAGFYPDASGRYITSAHDTDFLELAEVLLPVYGDRFPLPTKPLPKWLLMLIGPMMNKLLSRKYIRNNVNIPWSADNSKIKEELDMDFRPLKDTMQETFQSLVDENILKPSK
jgi:nucleoside-diphosphate-sugar epimerase